MDTHEVVLDEQDATRLLKTLYHGRKTDVHLLICACGVSADLRKNPKAWNGWQVIPFSKCPVCLAKPKSNLVAAKEYEGAARERFIVTLKHLLEG